MEDKSHYGKGMWLIKDKNGLFHPLNDRDREIAAKIPVMEENLFTHKRIRNPRFHRKYFAMLNLIFDNQDTYKDFHSFRKIMEMRSGYYDLVFTENNKEVYLPKSISYENLGETEFSELFEKVYIELKKFVDIDRETLENELAQFA